MYTSTHYYVFSTTSMSFSWCAGWLKLLPQFDVTVFPSSRGCTNSTGFVGHWCEWFTEKSRRACRVCTCLTNGAWVHWLSIKQSLDGEKMGPRTIHLLWYMAERRTLKAGCTCVSLVCMWLSQPDAFIDSTCSQTAGNLAASSSSLWSSGCYCEKHFNNCTVQLLKRFSK
jgi:hypothetical protein